MLKEIKRLYDIFEIDTYQFNTHYTYQIIKIFVIQSIYNSCFQYTNSNIKTFEAINLQIVIDFRLINNNFATIREKTLKEIKLI